MHYKTIVVILFFFIFIPSRTISAQSGIDYPTYLIQSGDTLGSIAEKFNISINELLQINNIPDPDLIAPGQLLYIPLLKGFQGRLVVTSPQLGQSFDDFLKKYQLNSEVVVALNQILSPDQVFFGSELIVPISNSLPDIAPIAVQSSSTSLVEISVTCDTNPNTFLIASDASSFSSILPGLPLFALKSEKPEVNLFAPNLRNVTFGSDELKQGSTVVINVQSHYPVKLSGRLGNSELTFYSPGDGQYLALQGIDALAEPGLVDFELSGVMEDGSKFQYSQPVLIKQGVFDTDPPLNVDPETLNPTVTKSENELVANLVGNKTPTKYWEGSFQSPAVYEYYNSLYGTRRTYNNDPTVTYHTGVDYGGGITLPIYAPADGQVVFSGPLTIRGNTTYIDHGWGVFSGFFHQNALKVKVGDFVSKGQIIGEVGNTGRVNGANDYPGAGAHLHWEVWVNGVTVDPLSWLSRKYP